MLKPDEPNLLSCSHNCSVISPMKGFHTADTLGGPIKRVPTIWRPSGETRVDVETMVDPSSQAQNARWGLSLGGSFGLRVGQAV